MEKNNFAVPVAVLLAALVIGGTLFFSKHQLSTFFKNPDTASATTTVATTPDPVSPALFVLKPDDHILGNPNARIRIVEYADFECPFCKRFHNTMLQVIEDYGKTGDVAWVYRHFPLDNAHPKARLEAVASECASELGDHDTFWKFMTNLLDATPSNKSLDTKQLPEIAASVGVDKVKFQSCLDSGRYASRIERDFEEGVDAGIAGTPFSFAVHKDGRMEKIAGAHTYKDVSTLLDQMLHAKPGEANVPNTVAPQSTN